jgi:hypothetical protein
MIGLPEIERPPPSYPPANPIEQREPEIKGAFEIPSPRGTAASTVDAFFPFNRPARAVATTYAQYIS